jgi:hypothetical protein
MYRRIGGGTASQSLVIAALVGVLGCSAICLAQAPAAATKPVADAQVEANVLKALASAADLANQPITTTTVYGVVTLSGTVQTEALRTEAETLTSRAGGVQKVVDEMTLSSDTASDAAQPADTQAVGDVPQSDGTMAPAPAAAAQGDVQQALAQGSPDSDNTQSANAAPNQAGGPGYGPGAPEYRQPYGGQQAPPPDVSGQQNGYPQQQQGYPPQRGYAPRRGYGAGPQAYGGQAGGEVVTVPSGAMVRIRINQPLDSGRTQVGTRFDGIVVNDVVAGGAVAIPRGASVQGTVVDAKKSGALKGRGELSLQLTEVALAGKSYPMVSNVWEQHGGDKTTETVNRTAIGGAIGALFGAAAGGGAGAAIGAGVGGALGLGSSAASGNGQVYVPSEGMLTFQLAQPATVATVSQQEMNRLAQGVPPGAQRPQLQRRYYAYPGYGPVYYRPYPYSPYPYPY